MAKKYLQAIVVVAAEGVIVFDALLLEVDDGQAPVVAHMHRHHHLVHGKDIHFSRPASHSRVIVFPAVHQQRIEKRVEDVALGRSCSEFGIPLLQKLQIKVDNLKRNI